MTLTIFGDGVPLGGEPSLKWINGLSSLHWILERAEERRAARRVSVLGRCPIAFEVSEDLVDLSLSSPGMSCE